MRIILTLLLIFTVFVTSAQDYQKIYEFQRVDTTWNQDSTAFETDSVFNVSFRITDTISKQNENNFALKVYTKDSIDFIRYWQTQIAQEYNAFGSFEAKKRDFIQKANKLRTELTKITGKESYREDVKTAVWARITGQYRILFDGTWHKVQIDKNGGVFKGQNKVGQITPYSFKYLELYVVPMDVTVDLYSNQGNRFEGNDPTHGKVIMVKH